MLAAAHEKLRSFAVPAIYPLVEGTSRGHVIVFSQSTPEPVPKVGVGIGIRTRSERDGERCSKGRVIEIEARGKELVAGVKRTVRIVAEAADVERPD